MTTQLGMHNFDRILLKGDLTMKKKVLYVGGGAAAVMLLLALLFGSDATSYVTTSVASVRDSVKNSVPVEFELERARQQISDIITLYGSLEILLLLS